MQSNKALEKLIYEIQALRGVAESVQQRIGLLNATITEVQLAISTLEGVSEEGSSSSMLVPIGGGSYLRATLESSDKLIVGVGADVAVEKTIAECKEDFQSRILELENFRTSLKQQFDEISTKMSGLQREAQKVAQESRGETQNV